MKSQIFEHIEFLLPKHNCIIVPDFGGFIVNIEPALRQADGSINAPMYNIVFNKDLKYNDGLLASSIQSAKNVSYSVACNIIGESVKQIKLALTQGNPIPCGKMGTLRLDNDGNTTFACNEVIMHPHLYGLNSVHLSLINTLESNQVKENKNNKVKYTFSNVAAVAAAVLLLLVPSVKIGQDNSTNAVQQSGFINTFKQSFIPPVNTSEINSEAAGTTTETDENEEPAVSKPERTYYIIIGGEQSENRALRLLTKFHSQGLENAAIVKSPTFYRIYIASYEDKSEAERFLDIFRLENPKYATAWLYSHRNR